MGLLDNIASNPSTMSRMGMAQGLLQAAAPSRIPVNIFQALGMALQGGQAGAEKGLELQQHQLARQMAMMKMRMAMPALRQMEQGEQGEPGVSGQTQSGGTQGAGSNDGQSGWSDSAQPSGSAGSGSYITPYPAQQNQSGNGWLSRLSPDNLAGAIASGLMPKEVSDIWKMSKEGFEQKSGSWYKDPTTGSMRYIPNPEKGVSVDGSGNVTVIPGALGTIAALSAAQKGAESEATAAANARYDMVPVYDQATGQMKMVPKLQLAQGAYSGNGYAPSTAPFGDATYKDETAKASAKEFNAWQANAHQANVDMAKYARLGQLLDDAAGGRLSPLGYEIQSAAKSLGIDWGSRTIANKDAAQALATSMVPELLKNAGISRLTERELDIFTKALPNLSTTAQGRQVMVENAQQLLQRQVDIAKMARSWQQKYGRIDTPNQAGKNFYDMLDDWTSKYPVFGAQQ